MFNFLKKMKKTKDIDRLDPEKGVCPNCGGHVWYEGPSGGMATNIKCAGCGLWFNDTPFGLDFIGIKDVAGESKKIVWFCSHCDITQEKSVYGEFYSPRSYPKCPACERPFKVCWSSKKFPIEYCNKCNERFNCYTTRGNF